MTPDSVDVVEVAIAAGHHGTLLDAAMAVRADNGAVRAINRVLSK